MASEPALSEKPGQAEDEGGSVPGGHHIQLRLLDGFSVEQDGRAVRMPQSLRRLVAFLGVRGRCCRVEIAGTLWPDVPETRAQASLRTVLWRLQRLTARPLVTGQGCDGRESLALADGVAVDVRTFVATAQAVLNHGDGPLNGSPLRTLNIMGELLPGWYDDWVLFERERLRQLQMHALEAIAERLTAAKRYSEAIEAAMAAVRLEPLRESAMRTLIAAHLAENNVVEAVRQFESFRDGLNSELGVEPTPDLERLVRSGRKVRV
jgi:DNA-binding SARP family transcriptional activator